MVLSGTLLVGVGGGVNPRKSGDGPVAFTY